MQSGGGFELSVVEDLPGIVIVHATGKDAWSVFQHESGGHRWQRVPPNERKDKVHSSTVTVAVFADSPKESAKLNMRDIEVTTCRGSGPGGQHRNKTETAVQVKHKPTGLIVRCESERSQGQNKDSALSLLFARLQAAQSAKQVASERQQRREMIGSGERSDKIRTVQVQNGQVVCHRTNRKINVERYLRGELP